MSKNSALATVYHVECGKRGYTPGHFTRPDGKVIVRHYRKIRFLIYDMTPGCSQSDYVRRLNFENSGGFCILEIQRNRHDKKIRVASGMRRLTGYVCQRFCQLSDRRSCPLCQERLDGAILDLSAYIAQYPNQVGAYFLRGCAEVGKKEWDPAISDFTQAIKLQPDKGREGLIYYYRGFAKGGKYDWNGALADFNKCIELNAYYAPAYRERGQIEASKGKLSLAMADLNKAINLTPLDGESYFQRGFVKSRQNDFSGAIADVTKDIELNSGDIDAYLARETLKRHTGDFDGAISDTMEIIKRRPNDAFAYDELGRNDEVKGDFADAMADFNKAIALFPQSARSYSDRGWCEFYKTISMAPRTTRAAPSSLIPQT